MVLRLTAATVVPASNRYPHGQQSNLVKRPNWDYFQTILSVISSEPGYLPESEDYQTLFPDGHVLARPKGDLDTPVNNVDRQ